MELGTLIKENESLKTQLETLRTGVQDAKWLIDHIFDKKKRVNWGQTYDIDWGRMNTALINIEGASRTLDTKEATNHDKTHLPG